MNRLLILSILSVVALMPVLAMADNVSQGDAYDYYLYEFHLTYSDGTLMQSESNSLSSGEAPAFPTGQWRLDVLDSRSRILLSQYFEPSALSGRTGILAVKYFNSGTTAQFLNPQGVVALVIDLSGSRVCDDNGSCDSNVGEDEYTCPGDCRGAVAATPQVLSATVSNQIPVSRIVGEWLLRIALGAAGVVLLVGISRTLDSRRSS